MSKKWTIFFLFFPLWSAAGFAKDFKLAQPGYEYHFPADHGSHEDYQIEWWYFTGHLIGKEGAKAGFELTFFRTGIKDDLIRQNPSKWHVEDIYSAHFAISDETNQKFWFQEKLSRAALGKAGAEKDDFHMWIDHWYGKEENKSFYLKATDGTGKNKMGVLLKLTPDKPVVVHGKDGISPKDLKSKNRSHYYSFTRLKTSGTLILNGNEMQVEGISWMDHEFGSSPLLSTQAGWDWFSIQLNNRTELMLYQIRNKDASLPFYLGTFISENGAVESLQKEDFTIKPLSEWRSPLGGSYPIGWEITVPRKKIWLSLIPALKNQELNILGGKIRYWEGSVIVKGFPSTGVGYVELTGYGSNFFNLFSQ